MEWTREKPKKDGLYWLRKDGWKEPSVVRLWDATTDMPMVAFIGTDWDKELSEVDGLWYGPIFPPKGGNE